MLRWVRPSSIQPAQFLVILYFSLISLSLLHSYQFSAPYFSAGESASIPTIAATTGTGGGISDSSPSDSCLIFSILQTQGGLTAPPGCAIPTSTVTKPNEDSPSTQSSTSSTGNLTPVESSSSSWPTSSSSSTQSLPSNTSSSAQPPTQSDDTNAGRKGPRGVGSAMPVLIASFLVLCAIVYFMDELLGALVWSLNFLFPF